MKQKVHVCRPFPAGEVDRLAAYFDVTVNNGSRYTPSQLHEALIGMDGAIVAGSDKVDDNLLHGLTSLKVVSVAAVGYNNIDPAALTRAGIIGTNSPGPADDTVADFAWGQMIATARRMAEGIRVIDAGRWSEPFGARMYGTGISGKTLGIIGM